MKLENYARRLNESGAKCGCADEHEINQLFFWFLEEGGELGVVHRLRRAEISVSAS